MGLHLRRLLPSRRRFVSFTSSLLVVGVLSGIACGAHGETDAAYGRFITNLAVAVNPHTHKVYAVDEAENSVSVTDERTGSIRMVKVGMGPIALAINPTTDRVYVASIDSDSISVIDGKRDAVV